MQVTNLYTSVACNRTTECADWGPSGLIAYGACNAVAVLNSRVSNKQIRRKSYFYENYCLLQYNGNSAKILYTLVEHTKRVNTVKWLDEQHLISGGDDANAVLWQLDETGAKKRILIKGHENGVNAVDGVRRSNGIWLLVTAAADSSIKLWHLQPDDVLNCIQTVQLDGGFCFSLRLTLLPQSEHVLMAFSGDDETVSLWAEQSSCFDKLLKLGGHEDWVRGLDFVSDGQDLILASGSQDNFIRLWRIAPRTEQQVSENRVNIENFSFAESGEIRVEEKILQVGKESWYAVTLESVLYGHEGWVYGVHWHKNAKNGM